MSDLLPCPFCGGEPEIGPMQENAQYITCRECGTEGPFGPMDRDAAIERWNKRAGSASAMSGLFQQAIDVLCRSGRIAPVLRTATRDEWLSWVTKDQAVGMLRELICESGAAGAGGGSDADEQRGKEPGPGSLSSGGKSAPLDNRRSGPLREPASREMTEAQSPAPCPPAPSRPEPREPVRRFAVTMELRLRANDYKGGWFRCDLLWLLGRLREETEELERAIVRGEPAPITHEAADVANFAMMIADKSTAGEVARSDPLVAEGGGAPAPVHRGAPCGSTPPPASPCPVCDKTGCEGATPPPAAPSRSTEEWAKQGFSRLIDAACTQARREGAAEMLARCVEWVIDWAGDDARLGDQLRNAMEEKP